MHTQFFHGAAHLRRTVIIDLAPALRRQPEVGSAVGIERTEQPLLFNHRTQPGHYSGGRLLLGQLRVVDLAGGVVQDHDQVVPTLILKPRVIAAVDVQHHARQGTSLTTLAVYSTLRLPLHQAGCLQRLLDPRVAQPDLMFLDELLVKVPHVQIEVLFSIQADNLLCLSLRQTRLLLGTPRRRSSTRWKPLASYRFFQRRIWRSLMPIISAACHHLIFPAVARKSTSCSFIARSTAVLG